MRALERLTAAIEAVRALDRHGDLVACLPPDEWHEALLAGESWTVEWFARPTRNEVQQSALACVGGIRVHLMCFRPAQPHEAPTMAHLRDGERMTTCEYRNAPTPGVA